MQQPDLKADSVVIAIQPEVGKLTAFAQNLAIKTAQGYQTAADHLKAIKGLLKQIEDARTRVTKPLNEALRQVNSQAKEASAPLATSELQIKRAMNAYADEQDRIRREEQARADEAARKEQEKLQQRATRAASTGKVEKAAELESQACAVVAPVINREPPKVSGITSREVWKFDVTDPSLVPREYLSVDETKIRKVVQALKGDTKIAGVRVYPERSLAAGAA